MIVILSFHDSEYKMMLGQKVFYPQLMSLKKRLLKSSFLMIRAAFLHLQNL